MFSKNNSKYFRYAPHIKVTLTDGSTKLIVINALLHGYTINRFEFVNSSLLPISQKIVDWFIEAFLPKVKTNDFLYGVSMQTTPPALQTKLKELGFFQ